MLVSEDAAPFGHRVKRLRLVDYYTVPWEDVPAGTPPAVMIATHELATGKEECFAWHLIAERDGIHPEEMSARREELERKLLQEFAQHLASNPRSRLVHWGLMSVEYGFPALNQRSRALGLGDLPLSKCRPIDLAALLKMQ